MGSGLYKRQVKERFHLYEKIEEEVLGKWCKIPFDWFKIEDYEITKSKEGFSVVKEGEIKGLFKSGEIRVNEGSSYSI